MFYSFFMTFSKLFMQEIAFLLLRSNFYSELLNVAHTASSPAHTLSLSLPHTYQHTHKCILILPSWPSLSASLSSLSGCMCVLVKDTMPLCVLGLFVPCGPKWCNAPQPITAISTPQCSAVLRVPHKETPVIELSQHLRGKKAQKQSETKSAVAFL